MLTKPTTAPSEIGEIGLSFNLYTANTKFIVPINFIINVTAQTVTANIQPHLLILITPMPATTIARGRIIKKNRDPAL